MEWTETGYILATRRHGETSVIVEAFTRDHGRHLGLVKGGRSARWRGVLQPGNRVRLTWRARLSEHLGHYAVEAEDMRAAAIMGDRLALAALNTVNALVRLLPERDPHQALHALYDELFSALPDEAGWPATLARFELSLLQELGFGLDLESCAATGKRDELTHVSPKSGRAVSREAADPYKDRLLRLPPFLLAGDRLPEDLDELISAFTLSGYFLDRDVFVPRGLAAPEARARLLRLLSEAVNGRG